MNSLIQRVCGLDLVHELMDVKLFSVLKNEDPFERGFELCAP